MSTKAKNGGLVAVLAFLVVTNPVMAEAGKQITGKQIQNGTVTSADLKNNNVKSKDIKDNQIRSADIKDGSIEAADLGDSAKGAKVTQYVADGSLIGAQDSVTVTLPGTWTAEELGGSSWDVHLVRNGPPSFVFSLGQTGNGGEGTKDGFYIYTSGGTAYVKIGTPSYNIIDTIRITRTVASNSDSATSARSTGRSARTGG